MSENTARCVKMPPSANYTDGCELPLRGRVLVVIGANGSGKTRFGAEIEAQNYGLHHRVSAHRFLGFPDRVQPIDMSEAELTLLNGSTETDNTGWTRRSRRWGGNPATTLLNDYGPLVTVMVSESFTLSDQYRVAMKSSLVRIEPPKTRIDQVKEIWESVLPDRELIFEGSRIQARNRRDNGVYHAKEMSDGERGVFYLIGEALSVPADGVFIVDEPELHLHQVIQSRLWDAIEAARPDCTFIYITHDLGFASSRIESTKVWLREYANGSWEWEVVPDTNDFPESMLLEIMGSRRPILFVEGDRGSLDFLMYGKLFQDFTVVPCGSCEVVINSTRSFSQMNSLHHNHCAGLIDNDGRTEAEVKRLHERGIEVLPVALIENLMLVEPVLLHTAVRLGHDPSIAVAKIKDRVFDRLNQNRDRVVSNLTRMEINAALRKVERAGNSAEEIASSFEAATSSIEPRKIYMEWDSEVGRVLTDRDYLAALRYYKVKGLPTVAGEVFGVKYQEQVVRWLRTSDSTELIAVLKSVVPAITVQ